MPKTTPEQNKALVLEAFDTLFNKRDYAAAERFWSSDYIQHSAHIPPGREGLFNLIKSIPPTLKYEPGTIVAEGDVVIVHGRFSDFGAPANWIQANFSYQASFGSKGPVAYETLLLDSMRGDATLFTRRDEVEAEWRIITPIEEAWAQLPAPEFPNYAAGSEATSWHELLGISGNTAERAIG